LGAGGAEEGRRGMKRECMEQQTKGLVSVLSPLAFHLSM